MAQQGFTVLSAKAANGEVVHINGSCMHMTALTADHVYVSQPWSDRDGEPGLEGEEGRGGGGG